MSWEETAAKKRAYVKAQIPDEWILPSVKPASEAPDAGAYLDELLPEEEKAITKKTLLQLREDIASKNLTAYEITSAFCHRAAYAHQIINCCSEIFFDKALARAKELDEIFATTGKLVGPLHGIPISLKDQLNVEGYDSTMGFVSLAFKPKTKEEVSAIAEILYDAGAVFYVKTSVPMSMMAGDTYSHLYGQTVNCKNRLLSAGGSSGGEASLIGSGASLVGLSTDIGGSIRIPAALNGIYGIRGSYHRLPYARLANCMDGQPIVPSVIGPSGRDLKDIEFLYKTIIDAEPWYKDCRCPPIPWRVIELPEKLCFGILSNNGLITPHPPVQRAMKLLKEKLEAAGHTVIEWQHPVPTMTMMQQLADIFHAEAYKELSAMAAASGEPVIKQITVPDQEEILVSEHWKQAVKKFEGQQAYDAAWMKTEEISGTGRPMDAWISPVWESPSYPAGEVKRYHCSYTFPANYLDYTSVVFPVTEVSAVDNVEAEYEPLNPFDEEAKSLWDYELFKGMPVCAQVHAFRYEEEKALKLAGVIDGLLK